MASNVVKAVRAINSNKNTSNDSISTISGRQSNELIIGFCGAIGADIKTTKKVTIEELESLGYKVIDLRLSDIIQTFSKQFPAKANDADLDEHDDKFNRYIKLQNLGDHLREHFTSEIMAEAAITEINKHRVASELNEQRNGTSESSAKKNIERVKTAYILDQLKNPSEVELLRLVYQNNFYLMGIIRPENERKMNLKSEGIKETNIDILIHRDLKSEDKNGQQTEKTILDSDIFIRNSQSHLTALKATIKRFFSLIHGVNGISPSLHEKGMYSAFSASLQSACLSRQVGAAIMDGEGNVVSTGKNDVPKPFGGLYSSDDGEDDNRCIHKGGKCYNDHYKSRIRDDIERHLKKANVSEATKLADNIYKQTNIASLIEFSRAIHAEMDAITSIARNGSTNTSGTTIYTTTYPCHNCARHIVAAGIKKVIYIEPYAKSLAIDLHDDAISEVYDSKKVIFESFEGVSPRRYSKFFFARAARKNKQTGEAVNITSKYKNHVDIQFLDGFREYESKIAGDYENKTQSIE